MGPFPVPKSPTVRHENVVGPSPSTADSTSSQNGSVLRVSSYDLDRDSGPAWESVSNASSEPPPNFDDQQAADFDNPANNYRKGERVYDFKNEHGIVCYKPIRGEPLVRCTSRMDTLQNMNPLFLNSTGGLIHFNKSLDDFIEFVVRTSAQDRKTWGDSLHLDNPDHLRIIREDPLVQEAATELRDKVAGGEGELTVQAHLCNLVRAIFVAAGWIKFDESLNRKTISGGPVAYSATENDMNRALPAAFGSEIDAWLRSKDRTRTVVIESKKPAEIHSATSKSAMIQLFTGALGERAGIGVISTGLKFGLYYFERTGAVLRVSKVLDVHELLDVTDDQDKLIDIAAYIAFYLADSRPAKKNNGEMEKVDVSEKEQADQAAAGREPAPKKPRTTQEERRDVRELGGKSDDVNGPPTDTLKAGSDVWEEVKIEGPDGKFAIITVLHADLDEKTRLAIMGDFEPESDEEY